MNSCTFPWALQYRCTRLRRLAPLSTRFNFLERDIIWRKCDEFFWKLNDRRNGTDSKSSIPRLASSCVSRFWTYNHLYTAEFARGSKTCALSSRHSCVLVRCTNSWLHSDVTFLLNEDESNTIQTNQYACHTPNNIRNIQQWDRSCHRWSIAKTQIKIKEYYYCSIETIWTRICVQDTLDSTAIPLWYWRIVRRNVTFQLRAVTFQLRAVTFQLRAVTFLLRFAKCVTRICVQDTLDPLCCFVPVTCCYVPVTCCYVLVMVCYVLVTCRRKWLEKMAEESRYNITRRRVRASVTTLGRCLNFKNTSK